MYADDLKLCKRIRSPDDAVALQTDLGKLCSWSDTWKLKLNPTKCKVITFTLRRKPIVASYSINSITLLLPPNRLRPSFFAIFCKRLNKNQRNFRSEHLRTCPNFHYLDILLSHKYFRHFPLTRNVNFQAADSLGE